VLDKRLEYLGGRRKPGATRCCSSRSEVPRLPNKVKRRYPTHAHCPLPQRMPAAIPIPLQCGVTTPSIPPSFDQTTPTPSTTNPSPPFTPLHSLCVTCWAVRSAAGSSASRLLPSEAGVNQLVAAGGINQPAPAAAAAAPVTAAASGSFVVLCRAPSTNKRGGGGQPSVRQTPQLQHHTVAAITHNSPSSRRGPLWWG
jgi:hypothetical protein